VLELLAVPFLACLVLTAMHVHLGLHILARGIIFVDLALAQLAALGMTMALLAGHPVQSEGAYWYAFAFTMGGAALFTVSRVRRASVPQEAIIGIVYAVSAAAAILVLDRAPQGAEHIKQLLVGGILTVTPGEVATLAILYAMIGVLHWLARAPLTEISLDPDKARTRGRAVGWWDLFFYVTFGLVVTSSVRVAGVLLVFSYLVVPATMSALLVRSLAARLFLGWGLGAAVSALGLWGSWFWDLPTGAAVVTAFGALVAAVGVARGATVFAARVKREGLRALAGAGAAVCSAIGLAGLLLAVFPRMDHPWLDWSESQVPALRSMFLNADDADAYAEAREAVERGAIELERLKAMQQEVRWGQREMSEEMQERLRQYLASRSELVTGDRRVMASLQARARERQRWLLGLPLVLFGAAGALVLLYLRRQLPTRPGESARSSRDSSRDS
jgi:zinc/manganese transport system permease protein